MSSNGTDGYVCDRCGADVGNGSVMLAAVVSVLDDQGRVLNFHLCLANCASRVLTKAALANLATQPTFHTPSPAPVPVAAPGPEPAATEETSDATSKPAAGRRRGSPRKGR